MNSFAEALVSTSKGRKIPDGQDLFGTLVGEWDFDWRDCSGTRKGRHVKGEWIFSWVLEGAAVQDVFICPSRTERATNPQPDGEYGTTIRIFNPQSCAWDVFYGCAGKATRLEARRVGDEIVLTEIVEQRMKWIFSEITANSFHWRHERSDDGLAWWLKCELFATRRK